MSNERVRIPQGWRLLKVGDVLKPGDKLWDGIEQAWYPSEAAKLPNPKSVQQHDVPYIRRINRRQP